MEHILNKEQIKHLKKRGLWPGPDAFGGLLPAAGPGSGTPRESWGNALKTPDEVSVGEGVSGAAEKEGRQEKGASTEDIGGDNNGCSVGAGEAVEGKVGGEEEEGEGGEEEEEDDMSDLFVNNNRAAMNQLRKDHEDDDSDDSDSSDDE